MSTLMSTDLNITRPTSRVSRPPGGATTISFGDYDTSATPVKAPPAPAAAPVETVVPPPTPAPEVAAKSVKGKVGVLIGGAESEFLTAAIVKALVLEGIKGSLVAQVNDIASLPYGAQNISKNVDVIIAAGFANLDKDSALANAVTSTLLQMGTTGKAAIIPGIVLRSSLLEAKALLPALAKEWAVSAHSLLEIKFGGTLELVKAAEPEIPIKPVYHAALDSADELLDILRESLKSHGARGITGIARKFRIADDNNNGQIELSEFTKVISEHGLGWTPAQIKAVFDKFDKDKSGTISYDEFLRGVRGPINDRRKNLILLAFEILDADKSGIVDLDDISAKYNAKKHPDVIHGKRSEADVLREFLDTFDTIEKDGKVTPAEFIEYYSNVSSSIDEDDYFELMIRNAWHISGGEGWCANSSNRRVLVTHIGGKQTVEEVKNDLGISSHDKKAILVNLKAQGIDDIESIETADGVKTKADGTAVSEPAKAAAAAPAVAPLPARTTGFNPRRQPGGASTFTLG